MATVLLVGLICFGQAAPVDGLGYIAIGLSFGEFADDSGLVGNAIG